MSIIPDINPKNAAIIEQFGGKITALSPLGINVEGIDLSSQESPPEEVIKALEMEMAQRGFLVFKNKKQISEDDFLGQLKLRGGTSISTRTSHIRAQIHLAAPWNDWRSH